jgi:hypothetical protein
VASLCTLWRQRLRRARGRLLLCLLRAGSVFRLRTIALMYNEELGPVGRAERPGVLVSAPGELLWAPAAVGGLAPRARSCGRRTRSGPVGGGLARPLDRAAPRRQASSRPTGARVEGSLPPGAPGNRETRRAPRHAPWASSCGRWARSGPVGVADRAPGPCCSAAAGLQAPYRSSREGVATSWCPHAGGGAEVCVGARGRRHDDALSGPRTSAQLLCERPARWLAHAALGGPGHAGRRVRAGGGARPSRLARRVAGVVRPYAVSSRQFWSRW